VKRVGEELVVFVVGRVLENRREDLKVLERDVERSSKRFRLRFIA
jgi:aspartyl/asparaginyl-tRNA synthetase